MHADGAPMESLGTALAISITARAIAALAALLAVPIYLRSLGVEAFGVIGVFTTLQTLVAFMDLGLGATLTRQLAGMSASRAASGESRSLALTFEYAYAVLACLIGAALALAAPLVSAHWVNLNTLAPDEVGFSLQLAAASLALSWPANLYSAGMAGLHRQAGLAISTALLAIMRVALAVLFLWRTPTLEAFFWSQLLSSVIQSTAMRVQLWRALPGGPTPRLNWNLLLQTWRFSGGMTAITITGILLTQTDRLIVSHLLPLTEFGVYVVAGTLAAGLYVVISPIFSIVFPRIAALWSKGDMTGAAQLYHGASQVMALLVLPLTAVLVCFPAQSLFVLTDDLAISRQGVWVLVFLTLGAAFNGIMNIPYALQLAAGWTDLSVWLNAGAIVILIPITWWAATRFGAAGAAAGWALLNLGYVMVTPQILHRRLLPADKWSWYWRGVLMPGAISFLAASALAALWQVGFASRWVTLIELAACWVVCVLATFACLVRLHPAARQFFRKKM